MSVGILSEHALREVLTRALLKTIVIAQRITSNVRNYENDYAIRLLYECDYL